MAPTHIHIPEELLEKIFLPHPIKSLMRLRCVCKLWDQVIKSKSFAKAHYDHQKTSLNTHNYILLDHYFSYSACLIDSLASIVLESRISDKVDIFGGDSSYNCLEAYGICDGLLCLSDHSGPLQAPIFLWNPILKIGKKLPSILQFKFQREDRRRTSYLCFGNHDGDYKVIKVVPFPYKYNLYIYSLSTNSWKFLKFDLAYDPIRNLIKPYRKALLLNGIAYIVSAQDRRVVSFDLSCEIMQETNIPNDFMSSTDFIMEEYGESIALIGYIGDNYGSVLMLTMRLSGNSFSWCKKLIIGDRIYPSSFIDKSELMIIEHNLCFFYNVKNGSRRRFLTLKGKASCPRRIFRFRESLLLLNETPYLARLPYLEDMYWFHQESESFIGTVM